MAHDKYTATEPPYDPQWLAEYLSRELRRIEGCVRALAEREDIFFVENTAVATVTVEENIIVRSSASDVAVKLPDAAACIGQHYFIKRTGTGAASVIVQASGTDTIEGVGSSTLSAQWQSFSLLSDGTQWLLK